MQRAAVTYVRHAMPVSDDGVESTAWHLSDQARRLAGRLASRLEVDGGIGALVSSTEPKAVETAEAIAAHWSCGVRTDERLREVLRPWVGNGYRAVAHAYLRGEPPDTWETYDAVAERVASAVADARVAAGPGPVVVVSHGLALAVHLGTVLGPDFDRDGFWRGLAFPDAWTLDAAGTLHRPLVGVVAP